MGFFKNYRERRLNLTAPESVDTLSAMERFFQGGKNWTKGTYHRMNGQKCLVGAAQAVRTAAIEDAQYWLRQAIAERHPGLAWLPVLQIESFNDSRLSFNEIAEVITRAKQLAAAARQSQAPMRQLPPPAPVIEILPPERVTVKRRIEKT